MSAEEKKSELDTVLLRNIRKYAHRVLNQATQTFFSNQSIDSSESWDFVPNKSWLVYLTVKLTNCNDDIFVLLLNALRNSGFLTIIHDRKNTHHMLQLDIKKTVPTFLNSIFEKPACQEYKTVEDTSELPNVLQEAWNSFCNSEEAILGLDMVQMLQLNSGQLKNGRMYLLRISDDSYDSDVTERLCKYLQQRNLSVNLIKQGEQGLCILALLSEADIKNDEWEFVSLRPQTL